MKKVRSLRQRETLEDKKKQTGEGTTTLHYTVDAVWSKQIFFPTQSSERF